MRKNYSLLLLITAMLCIGVGSAKAEKYHVFVCPADVWGSNYDGNGVSINYQKTDDTWSGVQEMTLTGFKDADKIIYGYEMDVNPNTSLKTLQFVNHGDYYGASDWGNSNDHVYHGYQGSAHKWTDIPATSNASAVYLVGSFNSWNNADANYALTMVDGNHWKGSFVLNGASNNYQFKVYAVDAPTGWGYHFSANGYYFGSNTNATQLWSNNNNDQIVPAAASGIFLVDVEYFGQYDNHGQLTVKPYNSVDLTISDAKYATYYNSALAYTMPSDCKGYIWGKTENKLVETYAADVVVPADEPLVIYSETAGPKTLVFATSSATASENNALLGTDESTALIADDDSYFYGLSLNAVKEASSVGFYWMAAGGAAFINGAHKAYLKLSKSSGTPVKGFVFGDETEDAIVSVNSENVDGSIYNLNGQRINKMQKGINIINGKKVLF